MTDDPHGPVEPAAGAGAGVELGAAASVSDSGSDRRNLVYLVPSMSGQDDPAGTEVDPSGGELPESDTMHRVDAETRSAPGSFSAVGVLATTSVLDEPGEVPEGNIREDWLWVQEWRSGRESTPWATGVALSVFSALVVGVAVWVLSAGLADRPVVAVLVNLLVAAGLTPAIWLSRGLPVLRWIAGGAAAGIIIGWASAILMLPFPS